MTSAETEVVEIDGQVKWFDPNKGFGFVVPGNGGGDVLLHANVLRNFGQSCCGRIADATDGARNTAWGSGGGGAEHRAT